MKKIESYTSRAKFLISGEYLVLKGARALALPLKFGQTLRITPDANSDFILRWKAYVQNKMWFEAELDLPKLEIIQTSDLSKAENLVAILKEASLLNPEVFNINKSLDVETHADFNINWGWGSSSTLVANVANWFRIDPMLLHFKCSSGSGYDVACANADGPIFYALRAMQPYVENAHFSPNFSQNLYFVYLGKKQRSHQSIKDFNDKLSGRESEIKRISEISTGLASAHDLEDFELLIYEHEQIMSGILEMPSVKETTFGDFDGSVKSLGAWGGDFVLMTWRDGLDGLKNYLKTKNLDVVFSYDEIVLER